MEPDSRMGTSKPVSAGGTPKVSKTHRSTVDALTIWYPVDCSALADTSRSPLEDTCLRTSGSISSSAVVLRVINAAYSFSVVLIFGHASCQLRKVPEVL